jgi:Fe-S-cluster containining protein
MGDANPSKTQTAGTLDDPAYQKAVFEQAYRQTCEQLDACGPDSDIKTLSRINTRRNDTIDAVAAAFASNSRAECDSGCSFCCHQMVVCTPLEIFAIARHIFDGKTQSEIAGIKQQLAQRAGLSLDVPSRYGADKPCALLESNRCSIYAHRPSLCRTMLSTSRAACETSLETQEQKVPFVAEPVIIAFMMQLGIDYALIKRKHVSTEKVEMSRALFIALENYEAAFLSWINGEDAFPNCHVDMGNGRSNQDLAEIAAAHCGIV